jgi:hypothetical protein
MKDALGRAEVERIRGVYAVRDATPGRHPALAVAYRRLNTERTRLTQELIATVAPPPLGESSTSGAAADTTSGAGWRKAGKPIESPVSMSFPSGSSEPGPPVPASTSGLATACGSLLPTVCSTPRPR